MGEEALVLFDWAIKIPFFLLAVDASVHVMAPRESLMSRLYHLLFMVAIVLTMGLVGLASPNLFTAVLCGGFFLVFASKRTRDNDRESRMQIFASPLGDWFTRLVTWALVAGAIVMAAYSSLFFFMH